MAEVTAGTAAPQFSSIAVSIGISDPCYDVLRLLSDFRIEAMKFVNACPARTDFVTDFIENASRRPAGGVILCESADSARVCEKFSETSRCRLLFCPTTACRDKDAVVAARRQRNINVLVVAADSLARETILQLIAEFVFAPHSKLSNKCEAADAGDTHSRQAAACSSCPLSPSQTELADQLIFAARRLHERNMLAGCDGNFSVRLAPGSGGPDAILITPPARPKQFLRAEEMSVCRLSDGAVLRGCGSSMETPMHTAIYNECPTARAVVHAHPPSVVAWTIAFPNATELPVHCLPELVVAFGACPIVPYQTPGSISLGAALRPFLKAEQRVLILQFHGAVCWGETLEEALNGMERVEHAAGILTAAHLLSGGNLRGMPSEVLEPLYAKRKRIHPKIR